MIIPFFLGWCNCKFFAVDDFDGDIPHLCIGVIVAMLFSTLHFGKHTSQMIARSPVSITLALMAGALFAPAQRAQKSAVRRKRRAPVISPAPAPEGRRCEQDYAG